MCITCEYIRNRVREVERQLAELHRDAEREVERLERQVKRCPRSSYYANYYDQNRTKKLKAANDRNARLRESRLATTTSPVDNG